MGRCLMLEKINSLKEKLYKELDMDTLDRKKILEVSQELDKLIVEYFKQENLDEREREREGKVVKY